MAKKLTTDLSNFNRGLEFILKDRKFRVDGEGAVVFLIGAVVVKGQLCAADFTETMGQAIKHEKNNS